MLCLTLEWVAVWFALSHQPTIAGWVQSATAWSVVPVGHWWEECQHYEHIHHTEFWTWHTLCKAWPTRRRTPCVEQCKMTTPSTMARAFTPTSLGDAEQRQHRSNLASTVELFGQHLRVSQLSSSWGCHKPACLLLPFLAECLCSPLILSQMLCDHDKLVLFDRHCYVMPGAPLNIVPVENAVAGLQHFFASLPKTVAVTDNLKWQCLWVVTCFSWQKQHNPFQWTLHPTCCQSDSWPTWIVQEEWSWKTPWFLMFHWRERKIWYILWDFSPKFMNRTSINVLFCF